MWDESDRDDPSADDTADRNARRRQDEPIDLPLDQGRRSQAQLSAPSPSDAPPHRRPKNPPLFPDWPPREVAKPLGEPPIVPRTRPTPPPAPPSAARAPEPVPVGSRGLAGLVDLAVIVLVTAVVALSMRVWSGGGFRVSSFVWAAAFSAELSFVGGVLALFLFGRTPGMALLALSAEEESGAPLGFGRAVARVALSALLPALALLPAIVRRDRRTLTDLVTSTRLRDVESSTSGSL